GVRQLGVGEDDAGPVLREVFRIVAPEPAGRPGDHGDLTFERLHPRLASSLLADCGGAFDDISGLPKQARRPSRLAIFDGSSEISSESWFGLERAMISALARAPILRTGKRHGLCLQRRRPRPRTA